MPPEVVDIPRCNNTDIEWYQMMPADPPLVDPKGEKLLQPPEGEDATLGQIIGLHIEMDGKVCWNKSNTMLVGQTQYLAGLPGKKGRHCTTLITQINIIFQCYYPNARQPLYQISR